MNYDGILAQLTLDERLIEGRADVTIEEGVIEEEQAAKINIVHSLPPSQNSSIYVENTSKSETSTPQRKISTSTRFMNAFQQLYTSATSPLVVSSADNNENETTSNTNNSNYTNNPANNRTPTKGMESKLMSMWHNVKYGWSGKLKSNFSKEQPVWLLGRCYHRKYTPPSSMESSAEFCGSATSGIEVKKLNCTSNEGEILQQIIPNTSSLYPQLLTQEIDEIIVPQELGMDAVENQLVECPWEEGIEGFRRDFYSRIWMTYRREFPTMNGSNYTSDCGWGCMLRSGQMLLAQGLVIHFLGRTWRYDPDTQIHSTFEDSMHKKIIKWFGDTSSKNSPFSIHALVNLGEQLGKKPGDWYGPASVSHILKQAVKNAALENADFDNITVYVAKNCTVYMQDVEDECYKQVNKAKSVVPWQTKKNESCSKSQKSNWKSLIVLIPLRLGTEKLNATYAHCLKLLLSTEYCIGIIGGRPKHSLYFVGFQEDRLIHLDPHYCQEMVDIHQENFSLHSFHCKSPRKLKTTRMDPSCCVGFYCETKTDFEKFVESVQLYLYPMRCASGTIEKILPHQTQPGSNSENLLSSSYSEINYPLFTFSRGRCLEHEKEDIGGSGSPYGPLQQKLMDMNSETLQQNSCTVTSTQQDDDDGETEEFILL